MNIDLIRRRMQDAIDALLWSTEYHDIRAEADFAYDLGTKRRMRESGASSSDTSRGAIDYYVEQEKK